MALHLTSCQDQLSRNQAFPTSYLAGGAMTNAPSASIFHIQLPALFATPAAESERCAVYVAATPDGRSEGLYAIPSTDDNHLPVRPSPDGVGKSTRVASPSETPRSDEHPLNM